MRPVPTLPTVAASLLTVISLYFLRHKFALIRRNIVSIILPPTRDDRRKEELASATRSYALYSSLAHRELSRMRKSYSTISRQHKRIGYELGYTQKLNTLEEKIAVNALVTNGIAELARTDFVGFSSAGAEGPLQLERMREVLKHFVRDWSDEGAQERLKTFSLILNELQKVPRCDRNAVTVLVPGAGLARLPWDIAALGFDTTSNEVSPYMNLAFRFLRCKSTTSRVHQHLIHPFAHWFSHQRTNTSLFRAVTFPDILPSCSNSQFCHKESDFFDLYPVHSGYDYIVTHFFIDTSHNIIATLQKIHSLLRSGGMWINVGPLLWMGGAQATMELSLEEVLELSESLGFVIRERQMVPSEYTRDDKAMMRWIYEAEFWIAVKV